VSGPLDSIGSLCCGVRSKRGRSVLNNVTTCDAAFHQNPLTTCFSFDPIKTRSGAFSTDLQHPFTLGSFRNRPRRLSDDEGGDGKLSVGLQYCTNARHVDVLRQVEIALHRSLGRSRLVRVDVRRLDDQPASVQLDDHIVSRIRLSDLQHQVESAPPGRFVPREHGRVERLLVRRRTAGCSSWR